MPITLLKYGNTNTYLCGKLLVDTDMPGTLSAFWRELKKQGIAQEEIRYVLATHYHPDHVGLIGELTKRGVRLLLLDHQVPFIHSSDGIFARDSKTDFTPIDGENAVVIKPSESRSFLASIGLAGEIVTTKSHSPDGVALILDDGSAIVGDLEPLGFLDGYGEEGNEALRWDWEKILRLGAKTVYGGHANVWKVKTWLT